MERILIYNEEKEAQKELDLLKRTVPQLQVVIDEFSRLGTKYNKSLSLDLDHLKSFFKDGGFAPNSDNYQTIEMTMLTQLFPDGKIGDVEVRLDKISSFFKTPDIKPVTAACSKISKDAYAFFEKGYFTLKSGKIGVVPKTKEAILESYKTYTESEEENERYHAARAAGEAVNKVIELAKEGNVNELGDLDRVLEYEPEKDKYIPGGSFIKFGAVGPYFNPINSLIESENRKKEKNLTPIQSGDWTGFEMYTPDPFNPSESNE